MSLVAVLSSSTALLVVQHPPILQKSVHNITRCTQSCVKQPNRQRERRGSPICIKLINNFESTHAGTNHSRCNDDNLLPTVAARIQTIVRRLTQRSSPNPYCKILVARFAVEHFAAERQRKESCPSEMIGSTS